MDTVEKTETEKWREEKVAFVSGLTGGPFWEVVVIFSIVPALSCMLAHLVRALIVAGRGGKEQSFFLATLVEWACTFIPMLLSMTLCADVLVEFSISLAVVVLTLVFVVNKKHRVVCPRYSFPLFLSVTVLILFLYVFAVADVLCQWRKGYSILDRLPCCCRAGHSVGHPCG